jgi:hypothetical protein
MVWSKTKLMVNKFFHPASSVGHAEAPKGPDPCRAMTSSAIHSGPIRRCKMVPVCRKENQCTYTRFSWNVDPRRFQTIVSCNLAKMTARNPKQREHFFFLSNRGVRFSDSSTIVKQHVADWH